MKTTIFSKVLFICLLALFVISCRSSRTHRKPGVTHKSVHHMPPGHAKKVYGHQSARAFAPGQQKKVVKNNKATKHKNKKKGRH
jgi:hypothetical protein